MKLQSLILVEIFLADGPCYIPRLWSEMFERQRTINVGCLLFDREIAELERQGLLKNAGNDKTEITKKGEIHLYGILLLGMMSKEALWKLEAKQDRVERDRLEDIEAEREGMMTEMSGYPDAGMKRV